MPINLIFMYKCIYLGSNKLDLEQHYKVMQTI